jgi:hypothetical protein
VPLRCNETWLEKARPRDGRASTFAMASASPSGCFEPLSEETIEALAGSVPETLQALADASGGLVSSIQQVLAFGKIFFEGSAGTSFVWLQCRTKYGASTTAVLGREVVPGKHDATEFARRCLRLLDPRLGLYVVRRPKTKELSDAMLASVPADEDSIGVKVGDTTVLYATTNPRSTRIAATVTMSEYNAQVAEEARRLASAAGSGGKPSVDGEDRHRLDKEFQAALARETSIEGRAVWRTLDIDDKSAVAPCMRVLDDAGVKVSWAVETRGGVHLMVEPKAIGRVMKVVKEALSKLRVTVTTATGAMEEHEAVEIKTDAGCPVPGTVQGGFSVRFVSVDALPRE